MEDLKDLKSLDYTSPREAIAERFHMSEALLAALNPGKKFDEAGQTVAVINVVDRVRGVGGLIGGAERFGRQGRKSCQAQECHECADDSGDDQPVRHPGACHSSMLKVCPGTCARFAGDITRLLPGSAP